MTHSIDTVDTSTDVKLPHIWGKLRALSCPMAQTTSNSFTTWRFYWWCYMQSPNELLLVSWGTVGLSGHGNFWTIHLWMSYTISSESLFSYQCLWCQIGLADPQHIYDMCNQGNSSKTGRPVFVQQNCHGGSMLCKAALHVEGCAWGANFLLNTFKSPWRLLTHPWLQLCCSLLQVLEQNGIDVRVPLINVC